MLLQLSHAVSVCELQRAGASALQQAGDGQIQARIMGEVERVGEHTACDLHTYAKTLIKGPNEPRIQCNKRSLQEEQDCLYNITRWIL